VVLGINMDGRNSFAASAFAGRSVICPAALNMAGLCAMMDADLDKGGASWKTHISRINAARLSAGFNDVPARKRAIK